MFRPAHFVPQPGVQERLQKSGTEVYWSGPQDFDAFVRSELVKWTASIKEAGLNRSKWRFILDQTVPADRISSRMIMRPEEVEANSLIGTPDQIMGKLEALRRAGVEYVIMSFGGSRESLRRFAHEIMPAFSNEPVLAKYRSRGTLQE